jgi:AcrR family transcriptional regulator
VNALQAERRRTQAERTETSSKGLLRAALELIAERGFRAMSLQAVGERAGYSSGLASHRFGSKEGLLKELVKRMLGRWGADVRDRVVGERAGVEALHSVAASHRAALEHSPQSVRALYMLFFESLIDMPDLRRTLGKLDHTLRDNAGNFIRSGIANETTRPDVDVEAQAALFLAVLRGITLQWLVAPEAIDLPRVYAALDDWLERGLAP